MIIPLFRSKQPVENFFSVFGNIKETNLTACLAYLISAFPTQLGHLFAGRENLKRIDIEVVTKDLNRHDIIIEAAKSYKVIEAKLGFEQNEKQITRYVNDLAKENKRVELALLDRGSWQSISWIKDLKRRLKKRVFIKAVQWSELHAVLLRVIRSKRLMLLNPKAYFIAEELANYMEVNNMSSVERKEVYCRDLATEKSIELFFRYHVYISQPKFYNSARGNVYFAPYFTGRAPDRFAERSSVKIGTGISYIAPIKDMQLVKRNEVKEFLRKSGIVKYKDAAKLLLSYSKERDQIIIFVLSEPLRAFLTPIKKNHLGFTGAMGAKSLTFQQLFEATIKG